MKATHDLDIKGLQGVASRLNEVDAGMNPVVHDVHSIDLVLGFQVGIKSLFNVLHDRSPRIVIVHEISKAGGIDNCQAEANAILFDICTD